MVGLLLLSSGAARARTIAPLRRDTAMGLLRRLSEGSPDTISIDIGGTLAKVVLFQPCAGPPSEDGQPPKLEMSKPCSDAFGPEQLALSVYAPELREIFNSYAQADQNSAGSLTSLDTLNLNETLFMLKEGKMFQGGLTVCCDPCS